MSRESFTPWTREYHAETLTAQADGWRCPTTGAVPAPISMGATYARGADYSSPAGMTYVRDQGAPGQEQVERVVAGLEGGSDALVLASGMAASTAIFAALPAGARVVVPTTMYFGLTRWLREFGPIQHLDVVEVAAEDADAVAAAVQAAPTALLWIETPANPTWLVTDIGRCAQIARSAGALLAVDNTVATPVHTRPLDFGADIVMHSATKYLNGHTDVVAGVLVRGAEGTDQLDTLWERIRLQRQLGGAVLGSFESYLLMRGMRTLFPRMRQISDTAGTVAAHFADHPQIARVAYPGLPEDPGHQVAASQMKNGYSGMLSLHVAGPWERSLAVARHCELFIRATSLGGVESLIEHRFTFEGPGSRSPKDMLRLSIGLEHPADLIEDLERALQAAEVETP